MSKYFNGFLFLLSLFLVKISFSQSDVEVRLASYATGDIVSVGDILKYPSLTLINRNATNSVKLVSYDCVFSNMDKKRNPAGVTSIKNETFALTPETITLLSKFLPGDHFYIKDITGEVANIK